MIGLEKKSLIDLSVIIVNYNVRDFLYQCISSLQKSLKGIKSEIIVVDNASDDGSCEMLRRRFPRVKLIENSKNLGFAKANNLGLKIARGKFILYINPDTIVQENTIHVMIDFFNNHPDAGLAGCKILNPDGTFQLACRRAFPTPWVAFTKIIGLSKLFPKSKIFGKYNLTYLNDDETYPVDAVSGSFMMVRREVIDSVGGMDENFFMYGEDLDLCYRIKQAGWQIYYVHSTQIIHYKGESTRRSSLDEIETFYEAMHLFVEKHFRKSLVFLLILRLSIALVSFGAFFNSTLRPLRIAIIDFFIITVSIILAELIWLGKFLSYPNYAYPIVFVVPSVIVIGCLYAMGVYTNRRMSVSRSMIATIIAYIFISSLTAFFREYAFSRMIMIISGILSTILISGWRLVFRLLGLSVVQGRRTIFGRKTLIVGTNKDAVKLYEKLRKKIGEGYEIVGFIGNTHKYIGRAIDGVKVVGSIANIGKVIKELSISDVIFAPKALSYSQILSVISRSQEQAVNFHLVPSTMEVIVGKASVSNLDDLPLIQISYNIDNSLNQISKRIMDIVISSLLLTTVYPIFKLFASKSKVSRSKFIRYLPKVFSGEYSLVGPPISEQKQLREEENAVFLGRPGVCGLVQLQTDKKLSEDDINQLNLYYARNQSFLFDVEILIKTWLNYRAIKRSKLEII